LVPIGDDMTRVNNQPNLSKVNSFRIGAGQPQAANVAAADTIAYCSNLYYTAVQRMAANKETFINYASPDPNIATDLFAFMAQRFANTFGIAGLDCSVTYTADLANILELIGCCTPSCSIQEPKWFV
jgi:hypothetical protein